MARAHLRFNVTDATGKLVQNAAVSVRKPGTTTPITDVMYSAWTAGSAKPNPLSSNAQGEVEAYIDVPGTDVPGVVDLLIEDNAHTAYYPDAPTVPISFTAFTETIELRRAPDMPWVDLKADCGAVGDSVADDTAAVVAAIAALDDGSKIVGRIYCPSNGGQVYKITDPINIGDGTKYVAIEFIGQSYYSASNGPIQAVQFRPDNINENAFNLKAPNGLSHSFSIKGIQVKYASIGTGVGFDTTGGDQMAALSMENCLVQNAGVGIKLGGSVNANFSNVSALTCGKGWVLTSSAGESPNLPQFTNCYAQSCVTSGFSVEGPVSGARFDSCVFQSNTGPGILIADVAYLRHPTFTSCWWEFPGSDMIRVDGVGAGYALDAASFVGCRFDGSTGAGGRHVINNNAADASSAMVRGLNIIACEVANLNGGKFTNLVNADPSASNDPCFVNLTVTGLKGAADFEGIATISSHPTQFSIFSGNHDLTEANIITNATLSVKPQHMFNSGSVYITGEVEIDGALNHDGTTVGFFGVTPAVRPTTYAASNVTTDRTYDANSGDTDVARINELADVLGTLIADLRTMGLVT